jgi:hypothetical protein
MIDRAPADAIAGFQDDNAFDASLHELSRRDQSRKPGADDSHVDDLRGPGCLPGCSPGRL